MTDLANGWAWTTLGEVCSHPQYGWTTRAAAQGSTKFLRTTDITRGSIVWADVPFCDTEPADRSKYVLHARDIVISRAGSVGASAVIQEGPPDAVFASYLIRFQPSDHVDERFVGYFLQCPDYWEQIADSAAGIALQNVNAPKLRALRMPMAPLSEQERIVAAIEEAFSLLDAGEAGLHTTRTRLKRMRDSVLTAAAIGQLVPQDHTDTPASSLLPDRGTSAEAASAPGLPDGWCWTTLGSLLSDIEAGKSYSAGGRPAGADEMGVIKVSAMTWGRFRADENKVLPPGTRIDPRWVVRGGDLLLSRANTSEYVGACVLVPRDHSNLILSDKSLRLIPVDGVQAAWLVRCLRSRPVREQIQRLATGTKDSMRNISQEKLRSIRLALPPPEERARLVTELDRLFSFIEAAERAVSAALGRSTGLRRSVLKAAFEGRLVDQHSSDEPASVLLERIASERTAAPATASRQGRAKVEAS
ncbi:MAG: restriction endonuclease subunit S [Candidatus Nanopelagicales bacterium]|jgi:type I restriction enzyme S subunit|nr:restriction endonuclease subunit S [Candidatus Nanopelagicales bacterium]MCU0296205.1 restriction endonuclease subunit S [Candidatus Nanopelagicales bacterium]